MQAVPTSGDSIEPNFGSNGGRLAISQGDFAVQVSTFRKPRATGVKLVRLGAFDTHWILRVTGFPTVPLSP